MTATASSSGSGYEVVYAAPPGIEPINYTLDPHVEVAFWLICGAIFVIVIGWIIDMAISDYRKSKGR